MKRKPFCARRCRRRIPKIKSPEKGRCRIGLWKNRSCPRMDRAAPKHRRRYLLWGINPVASVEILNAIAVLGFQFGFC